MTEENTQNEATNPEPVKYDFYFVATVEVSFEFEGNLFQDRENVLLQLDDPRINNQTIKHINLSACNRIIKQRNLDPESIKKATIINISMLGQMSVDEFEQTDNNTEISTGK